ncbi:hypothetical protein HZC07_01815 [Candidatus Micrarchaeota archaeon]|nr:hypothetical protein [Candidatus Micrarchaeota archaeon]
MKGKMKGQLSIEYLLLSTVALALLAVSVLTLSPIKAYSSNSLNRIEFKSTAEGISNSISEVCALGNGNSQSFETKLPIIIQSASDAEDENLFLINFRSSVDSNLSITKSSRCEIVSSEKLNGKIIIKNKEGKIEIS